MRLSEVDRTEFSNLPASPVRLSSKGRLESATASLVEIRRAISDEEWTEFGFKELQMLGKGLQNIDRLVSVEEVYSHLTVLRMWMFCVELDGDAKYQPLGIVMKGFFYVMLMAVTPYMPPTCRGHFSGICKYMVRTIQKEGFVNISPDVREIFELFCKNRFT
jgi:hypothetical protein